jgi:cold shock CspA family protein
MASVRVGLFPPVDQPGGGSKQLQATIARVAEAGVDHLCVGDHVSFFVGAGSDGLVTANVPARQPG